MEQDDLATGARNLLVNCARLEAGQSLLVLHEPASQGYYDETIVTGVMACARDLGLVARSREVPFSPRAGLPGPDLACAIRAADCTVSLARLGDQLRFDVSFQGVRSVISYALDGEMLASDFGGIDYGAFVRLKHVINAALVHAGHIRVTCPAGTDFSGAVSVVPKVDTDTTITRFPLSVFSPVLGSDFSGRIAQRGFLVGTGSNYYDPYAVEIRDTLYVDFSAGRITGFDGTSQDVKRAEDHYAHVAGLYGIDPFFMHSWHAGIHPGCAFTKPASADLMRWTGSAFGNPRLLHFHTCGAYAPGEISLNLLDPTIEVDGVKIYDEGRLYPCRIPGGQAILDDTPGMQQLFDNPVAECGLGPDGVLSFT